MSRLLALVTVLALMGCKEEVSPPANSLDGERQSLLGAYRAWSQELIAQDYSGALQYCAPNSNCVGRTGVHRDTWNAGGQSYDDFTYMEASLTAEWLDRGYGEVLGNEIYYQQIGSEQVEYRWGFYSSARRIDGQWRMDGFNDDLELDWWR